MADEMKSPLEWALELGHVRAAPRDGRQVLSPTYRAADGLHHWSDDVFHAPPGHELRITRAEFEAALLAPGMHPRGLREPAPVLAALSPYAPPQVRALAVAHAAELTTTTPTKENAE